jgi:hypothetical protein
MQLDQRQTALVITQPTGSCPFCHELMEIKTTNPDNRRHPERRVWSAVHCPKCGLTGPVGETDNDAVGKYNYVFNSKLGSK